MKDLGDALKLNPEEKKDIQAYYLSDGVLLKNILNNDSLSPFQQAQQVGDLRDARNAKIEALLEDADRQHKFFPIEARYRVALTELAAASELVPPPPAPAAASTNAAPAQTEQAPATNSAPNSGKTP